MPCYTNGNVTSVTNTIEVENVHGGVNAARLCGILQVLEKKNIY